VSKLHNYSFYNIRNFKYERKAKVYFESREVEEKFEELIAHKCSAPDCGQEFRTFKLLADHNRKEHSLHFCEICCEHVQVRRQTFHI